MAQKRNQSAAEIEHGHHAAGDLKSKHNCGNTKIRQHKRSHADEQDRKSKYRQDDRAAKKPASINCIYAKRCGGCEYINTDYSHQLKVKQAQVKELLKKFAPVEPIVPMDEPYYYRNKVSAAIGHYKGRIIAGVYEKNSHRIVDIEECKIEDRLAGKIVRTVVGLFSSFRMKAYDEDSGYGLIRHVLVRIGKFSGEIMVVIVTASPIFPNRNNFIKALREKLPQITTIIQNINPRGTSMVLGDREEVLFGKGFIADSLCGLKFRISSKSFYQVNPIQTQKLYNYAIHAANIGKDDVVLDAYCGVGTIGLIASAYAKQVIGVELNKDAVRDAVANAKQNKITNIRFFCADATEFMLALASEGEQADILIMDPPRAGSTKEFIQAAAKLAPKRIVYISCEPKTLARDLVYFKSLGYRAEKIQPFDCFSHTEHVETVVLLQKRNS